MAPPVSTLSTHHRRLRASWAAGGYPPRAPQSAPHSPLAIDRSHLQEGTTLLQLLRGGAPAPTKQSVYDCGRSQWVSRAIAVYREALAGDMQPSMRVLDRLLACMRQPAQPDPQEAGGHLWSLVRCSVLMRA